MPATHEFARASYYIETGQIETLKTVLKHAAEEDMPRLKYSIRAGLTDTLAAGWADAFCRMADALLDTPGLPEIVAQAYNDALAGQCAHQQDFTQGIISNYPQLLATVRPN